MQYFVLTLNESKYADKIAHVLAILDPGTPLIHCIIDTATHLASKTKMGSTTSGSIFRALNEWIKMRGIMKVLVPHNVMCYSP